VKEQTGKAGDRNRHGICVREFQFGHQATFRRLNEEWLNKYFRIEEKDRQLFDDPESQIIAKGGVILMLESNGEPVGCCALMIKDGKVLSMPFGLRARENRRFLCGQAKSQGRRSHRCFTIEGCCTP
jgi:hypothetical protein